MTFASFEKLLLQAGKTITPGARGRWWVISSTAWNHFSCLARFSESDDTDGNSGLKRILHNNITVNWHVVCLGYQDKFYMEFSFEGRKGQL